MNTLRSFSAPGKLVIAGEYAVLEGFEALAIGIDRRVKVVIRSQDQMGIDLSRNKLVGCVLQVLEERGLKNREFGIEIDSSELHTANSRSSIKLGVGSSSGIAVALSSAVLDAFELDATLGFEIAFEAHRRFTNQRGSGIDVATSFYGGAIRYALVDAKPKVIRCNEAFDTSHLLVVHTGIEQSTSSLLSRISPHRSSKKYGSIMAGIGLAARNIMQVMTSEKLVPFALHEAVAEHNFWMRSLGTLVSAKLLSDEHLEIEKVCMRHDGFAKPSGAGAGDISLCFIAPDAQKAFAQDLARVGFKLLPFKFCTRGLESH